MSIKLVAIDIDGTLLNSDRKLTDVVAHTIKKASDLGIKIVLTTGRPTLGVLDLVQELGLENDHSYMITYNGAVIQNAGTKEVMLEHALPFDDYLDIELLSRKLNIHLHAQDYDNMYTANKDISPYTINEAFLTGIPLIYQPISEMTPSINIIKAMMIDDESILDQAIAQIPAHYHDTFAMVKSAPYYYEILNKKATKGNAVKELSELLGLKPEHVMSIGDNENDLTMIEFAGTGVAMGNAVQSVKDIANKLTKSNDEHGVAYAIEEWVLKNL